MSETEDEYNARVESEHWLDPLHVMTPMLQRVQREFPSLNTGAGGGNWLVIASYANIIVALRAKGLSSPDIEDIIRETPMSMFRGLYERGLVKKG